MSIQLLNPKGNVVSILKNRFMITLLICALSIVSCTPSNEAAPTEAPLPTEAPVPTDEPTASAESICTPTPATLTAYDEGLNDGHGPELAVDGEGADVESRWSADGEGRWIMLDIGGPGTVIELATAWYKADERTAFFDVETSLDGEAWTTVLTGLESQGDNELHAVSLDNIHTRFVRIVGYGNSENQWNSLLEAEIQTCGDVIPGPPPTLPPTPTAAPTPVAVASPTPGGNAIPDIITNGELWDLEGEDPHPLVDPQTLVFVPLEAQYTSPNGNGWRHEYKIRQDLRVAMTETYEEFQATVKVEMSDGGKTIIAQHHASDLGTIMKVYVADSSESGFYDSEAANGIFDVYVRLRNKYGVEEKFPLGTIESGDSFSLHVINDYGLVRVEAFGESFELEVEDDSASYLKFGNYLQSQTPVGSVNCGEPGNSSSFAECYEELSIMESTVTMTDVTYTRETQ